jgi:hypothetical protein
MVFNSSIIVMQEWITNGGNVNIFAVERFEKVAKTTY